MNINSIIQKSSLNPKELFTILVKNAPKASSFDINLFKGILNLDFNDNSANYCPAISFFQLIFHCENISNIINGIKPKNKNETIIKQFFSEHFASNKLINISKFTSQWKGWSNKTLITNQKFDINEFIEYFLQSSPKQVQNLFYCSEFVLGSKYSIFLNPVSGPLQNILNNQIGQNCINNLPEYILITICRKSFLYFDHQKIDINTFIQISNQAFKFVGAITFSNEHYHTIIKLFNHYFLYDDNDVCPLFCHDNNNEELIELIKIMDYELNSNTSILLYRKTNEQVQLTAFESVIQKHQMNAPSKINIKTLNQFNLQGIIQSSFDNSYKKMTANSDRTNCLSFDFLKYRHLLLTAKKIFNQMNFTFDEDLFNSTSARKNEINNEIAKKGQIVKDIFIDILHLDDFDGKLVKKKLQKIISWYNKFDKNSKMTIDYEAIVNDSLTAVNSSAPLTNSEANKTHSSNFKSIKSSKNYKCRESSSINQRLVNFPKNKVKSQYDADDNQFSLNDYKWDNRIEIENVQEIIMKIRKQFNGVQSFEGHTSAQLRLHIERDMIKFYHDNEIPSSLKELFVSYFISINCNYKTMFNHVRMFKELHGLEETDVFMSEKTLYDSIDNFDKLTFKEKEDYLANSIRDPIWGGKRSEYKITEMTVKCLIALMIDFPGMSAVSYTCYINSVYGTNLQNPVQVSTIQKYVRELKYSVNWSKFEPPSRNSLGISVLRASWCSISNDFLNNRYIIPAFVDEAAVIASPGKKNSFSFIEISPVINDNKNIMTSVISMVIPHFGIIYKFFEEVITIDDHLAFIHNASLFIKQYLSDPKLQIVIFEDNIMIHNIETIPNEITEMNVSIIPNPPFSQILNHVVGEYYSFIKKNLFINKKEIDKPLNKKMIMLKWDEITNNNFDLKIIDQAYIEWLNILHKCISGQPIDN